MRMLRGILRPGDGNEWEKDMAQLVQSSENQETLETSSTGKNDELVHVKKDVRQHMRIINEKFDPAECDENPLLHIENSAEYIHNLRRQRRHGL